MHVIFRDTRRASPVADPGVWLGSTRPSATVTVTREQNATGVKAAWDRGRHEKPGAKNQSLTSLLWRGNRRLVHWSYLKIHAAISPSDAARQTVSVETPDCAKTMVDPHLPY
jgi:hypothetical protein